MNQATCLDEPDAADERSLKRLWKQQFVTFQPGFSLGRALYNHRKLARHFIQTFRTFYTALPVDGFLSGRKDQRCHLVTYALIWWELYALFTP